VKDRLSRPTTCVEIAFRAPPTPATAPEITYILISAAFGEAPMAWMRSGSSLMPRQSMPNGERTRMRSSTKTISSSDPEDIGRMTVEIELEAPNSGSGAIPDRPSLPPVQDEALLANSWKEIDQRNRQHQLRQSMCSQDDGAADQPGNRATGDAGKRHQKRIVDAIMRAERIPAA
jgi:hypothetical protein